MTPYTSHLVVEPGLRRTARVGPGDTVPPGGGGSGAGAKPTTSVAAGPTSPGPSSPGSPGAGGVATGSEAWFLGERKAEADIAAMADELSRAGVLPKDAPHDELVQLARLVTRELRESEQRLEKLGDSASGERAVDDSVYLASLMRGGQGGGSKLLELFTRRVQDRTFVLREGVWIEQSLAEKLPEVRRVLEAFSAEYFQLLKDEPKLAPYLALSPRLVLKWGDAVLEIREPAPEPEEAPVK